MEVWLIIESWIQALYSTITIYFHLQPMNDKTIYSLVSIITNYYTPKYTYSDNLKHLLSGYKPVAIQIVHAESPFELLL